MSGRKPRLKAEEVLWAAEQYNAGVTLRTIADLLSVSHTCVRISLLNSKLIKAERKRKAGVEYERPPRKGWVPKPAKAKAVTGPNMIAGLTLARLMGRRA